MKQTKRAASIAAFLGTMLLATAAVAGTEKLTKTDKIVDGASTKATTEKTIGVVDAMELTTASDFTLKDTDGKTHTLSDYVKSGKTVVLEWFNPDCPFVKKHHEKHKSMNAAYAAASKQGVVWLAINSGSPGKQGNGLERNQKARVDFAMAYPVLLDESGAVGRQYGAKTTPHMFVIGKDMKLEYAGAFDSDASPMELGETVYVSAALDAVAAGKPVENPRTKSYGCSVKYGDIVP